MLGRVIVKQSFFFSSRPLFLLFFLLTSAQLLADKKDFKHPLLDDIKSGAYKNWKIVPKYPLSPAELASLPKTVIEAISDILPKMSEQFKDEVRNATLKDLIRYHHGWGTGIRNAYGLWRGNDVLIESACGKLCHPDTVSTIIIEAVWAALQD